MSRRRTTLLQGTLDLLILKALAAGELHGLGVSRRIEQITAGAFTVLPGSLFPALQSSRRGGLARSRVAAIREQPTRKVLPVGEGRTSVAGRGDGAMESHRVGHRACLEA